MKDRIFDKNVISKAIYGSITILAVLLAMEDHPPSAWLAFATLFGTIFVIALAESYSEIIGEIIAGQKKLDRGQIRAIWRHARPVFALADIPITVVFLSALGLYPIRTALVAAQITIYLALFVYGLQVGHLLHASRWRIFLSGLFSLGIGAVIGLIKFLLH